jgi:uncharacterized protein (TIGR03435 family)
VVAAPESGFQVATIKPSDPNKAGWMLGTRGDHFLAQHVTLADLITFSYGVHTKQIVGGPAWIRTDRFDVEGVPEAPGRPARAQLQAMLRPLLAERFHLTLQPEKRELAVYALVVDKGGPKLTKAPEVEGEHPGYGFPRIGATAEMKVMHMTMTDFVSALQRTVTDRPVLDQTGLTARYGFSLTWTPDDSQFLQMPGIGTRPATGAPEPSVSPGLFTAVREQLGLKLEAVKAPVDCPTVEAVERPSAN